jgi:hypothetical protein
LHDENGGGVLAVQAFGRLISLTASLSRWAADMNRYMSSSKVSGSLSGRVAVGLSVAMM